MPKTAKETPVTPAVVAAVVIAVLIVFALALNAIAAVVKDVPLTFRPNVYVPEVVGAKVRLFKLVPELLPAVEETTQPGLTTEYAQFGAYDCAPGEAGIAPVFCGPRKTYVVPSKLMTASSSSALAPIAEAGPLQRVKFDEVT
ncbi:unannotated protein [freshwater metagenome]|uniref:Unannotated protein n=1 Tax=freshwater metagenome TaxID=449393 RepID=A0A6J7CN93_9ZZZZ